MVTLAIMQMMKGEWFFISVGRVNSSSMLLIACVHLKVCRSRSFALLHFSFSDGANGAQRDTDSIAL